jgi:hypothetical protein
MHMPPMCAHGKGQQLPCQSTPWGACACLSCCSTGGAVAALANPPNPLLVTAVEALFKFPPLFDSATKKVSMLS